MSKGRIAFVSNLSIGEDNTDKLCLDLLIEYLIGDFCEDSDKAETAKISRLIIASNSLGDAMLLPAEEETTRM